VSGVLRNKREESYKFAEKLSSVLGLIVSVLLSMFCRMKFGRQHLASSDSLLRS